MSRRLNLPRFLKTAAALPIAMLAAAPPAAAQCWQVSPSTQLLASDAHAQDLFGGAVAISSTGGGDTAVAGAEFALNGAGVRSGAAYVYTRPGGGGGGAWSQQAKLVASDGALGDDMGHSAAISGDTIVLGAPSDSIGANTDQGSAYVFVRSGLLWTQQAKLTASDGAAGDRFGESVAILGDRIIVGAPRNNIGPGAAYIFNRVGQAWTRTARLSASDPETNSWFGNSVAITNAVAFPPQVVALVGAPNEDNAGGTNAGSVYAFRLEAIVDGAIWVQRAKLLASDGATGDFFGGRISASGGTFIVGAQFEDNAGGEDAGAAYVFTAGSSGAVWTQRAKLLASDAQPSDNFGRAVAISGGTILVGAILEDSGATTAGAAYLFTGSGAAWTPRVKLQASDPGPGRRFGLVGVSGTTVLVGAPGFDPPDTWPGAAYAFDISTQTITQQPASATVCLTGAATFTAAATGTAPLAYVWMHNGIPIAGANLPTHYIAAAAMADAGSYDCVVTNACGIQFSTPATLAIVGPDPDCNGVVTPADVAVFINHWFASLDGSSSIGDYDANGVVNPVDVALFVTDWFAHL